MITAVSERAGSGGVPSVASRGGRGGDTTVSTCDVSDHKVGLG